jgi:hypothetical protein
MREARGARREARGARREAPIHFLLVVLFALVFVEVFFLVAEEVFFLAAEEVFFLAAFLAPPYTTEFLPPPPEVVLGMPQDEPP